MQAPAIELQSVAGCCFSSFLSAAMADAPARDAAAKIQADMASAEVAAALSKLGGLPGVASVNTKPQKPAKVANNFGVCLRCVSPAAWQRTSDQQ